MKEPLLSEQQLIKIHRSAALTPKQPIFLLLSDSRSEAQTATFKRFSSVIFEIRANIKGIKETYDIKIPC